MHSPVYKNHALGKVLLVICLLFSLVACSQLPVRSNPSKQSTRVPTHVSTASLPETLFPNLSLFSGTANSRDRQGNYITNFPLYGGLQGALADARCGLNFMSTNVVLATDSLTYDAGELQDMAKFFDKALPGSDVILPPLPPTLKGAVGIFTANVPYWGIRDNSCELAMYVVNKGQSVVQIDQASLKLGSDAKPNNNFYRLIDVCTLQIADKLKFCPIGLGSTGGPFVYSYKLGAEHAGIINSVNTYTGLINTSDGGRYIGGSDGPIILHPGDSIELELSFEPKDVSSHFIYSLTPELLIDISHSQKPMKVDVTQLSTTIAFLDPHHQINCYQLVGNRFVPIAMGPLTDPSIISNGDDRNRNCA